MNSLDAYKAKFETSIKSQLQELELLNARDKKRLKIGGILALIAWIGGLISLIIINSGDLNGITFFAPLALGVLVFYLIYIRKLPKPSISEQYKQIAMVPLLEQFDQSIQADFNSSITKEEYDRSKLYLSYDKYDASDLITGKLGATDFKLGDVQLIKRSNGKNKRDKVEFHGVFFIADFNKDFGASTIVYDKRKNGARNLSWDEIKLEDPRFHEQFIVYADDQIQARYVLSLSLMTRLMALKEKMGTEISVSFVESKIYIAIHTKVNLFEPPKDLPLYEFAPIEDYFNYLNLCFGIVEDLNLNTRIWSKE